MLGVASWNARTRKIENLCKPITLTQRCKHIVAKMCTKYASFMSPEAIFEKLYYLKSIPKKRRKTHPWNRKQKEESLEPLSIYLTFGTLWGPHIWPPSNLHLKINMVHSLYFWGFPPSPAQFVPKIHSCAKITALLWVWVKKIYCSIVCQQWDSNPRPKTSTWN